MTVGKKIIVIAWVLVIFLANSFDTQATCKYLKNLTGEEYQMGNMLTWMTATETDNKEFLIQKSSDNQNFTTIGQVKSKGNSAKPQAYRFLDINAQKGVTYYRLQQVNVDGSDAFSKSVAIEKAIKNNFTIMSMTPPTIGNQVEITLTASANVEINYLVEKLNGQPVYTGKQKLNVGMNLVTVDVSGLELGAYRISLIGGEESETLTFKNIEKKNVRTYADFDDGK